MISILYSVIILVIIVLCAAYWWLLALASVRQLPKTAPSHPLNRFAIAIPAHDEEAVIGYTVAALRQLNYPQDKYDIYVVADYCSDLTCQMAAGAGAIALERSEGERGSKGSALKWLFEMIFKSGIAYDAIVIFDADTRVDPDFLQFMNARLNLGAQVVQGKHVISNPRDGWFPALNWAMMTIDNRFSNHGRANLKLSAKHMGDSICFRSEILRHFGWGKGLTEDYELRFSLILDGIVIQYEPQAIGYGQSIQSMRQARAQRLRWARGMADARKVYRRRMFRAMLRKPARLNIDATLGMLVPSYSTLTLISILALLMNLILLPYVGPYLTGLWALLLFTLFIYPLFGLALEKAPAWAYLAVLSGPFFILWRTLLNIHARLRPTDIAWVRTEHHKEAFLQTDRK
jgi:cellulose synthase/poly-beta-1,6-N-acetylglucosamine synthase-like glycosyltransferase